MLLYFGRKGTKKNEEWRMENEEFSLFCLNFSPCLSPPPLGEAGRGLLDEGKHILRRFCEGRSAVGDEEVPGAEAPKD